MQHRHNDTEAREIALDACIDRLVSGGNWQSALPSDGDARREVLDLLAVANRLVEVADRAPAPAVEMKQRVWQRVNTSPELTSNHGFFRRLSGLRVLYFPPARPTAMQKVLWYRLPALPPLVVRFAEAS